VEELMAECSKLCPTKEVPDRRKMYNTIYVTCHNQEKVAGYRKSSAGTGLYELLDMEPAVAIKPHQLPAVAVVKPNGAMRSAHAH
jgi:hypothetical protein